MLEFIKTLYYYFFCILQSFFRLGSSNWAYQSKAIILITVLECFLVVSLISLFWSILEIDSKWLPKNNAYIGFPLAFIVYGLNHWLLLKDKRWMVYQEKYDLLPNNLKITFCIVAATATVGLVILVVLFYYLSGKINGIW